MNSILHNAAALAALQTLNQTQSSLNVTQMQVSSGLAVSSAADNAAYWSIATQLGADNGMVSASNSALSQGQAVLDTATTAINSVITTINAIQTALTEASNPGAVLADINTTLASLGSQLTDAVTGASFNGTNILDGSSIGSGAGANVSFVSGFNASPSVNTVTTINLSTQALYNSTSPSVGSSELVQTGTTAVAGTYDLTKLGSSGGVAITATNAADALTAVNAALSSVTLYSASIGATQDRMTAQFNLNSALQTNYADGISSLVDADMNQASTRLQALQTQEQLGVQALSIANQNAQMILKLFS